MGYYPIFVDLADRSCLVIGGGAVAERRVGSLLEAGARITVVSPVIGPGLAAWAQAGRIRRLARPYRPGDLAGYALAFVATDDVRVSARVAREGRAAGVWVNAADQPAHCDFVLPSVLRRGALTVAVGTGGASPALARVIREELETYFTPDYTDLAAVAGEVRRELRERGRVADAAQWRRALGGDLRALLADGRRDEARALLLQRLEAETCRPAPLR